MNRKGEKGERIALEYLTAKGYGLVAKNYSNRFGEIDIIMRQGEYLVFVEVKQRRDKRFARAAEFVTPKKQAKLRAAALGYLSANATELYPRFDIVEVYTEPRLQIEHLQNAF
ncbi:MAG: YraN family protein [Oscillospiraceae bacterium]|nr:YraN family protein [Oscillospiraceae bacterium]